MAKNHSLSDLEKLENQHKNPENNKGLIDGYIVIEQNEIPQEGILYPESWKFAYRCPEAKEVANFSVIQDGDNPAIVNAIEDLLKRCVVIYDTDSQSQISAENIADAHRTFFMLKLRDAYLKNNPTTYNSICTDCQQPMDIKLTSDKLIFPELSEDLLKAFDGKRFKLDVGDGDIIEFLLPTIGLTSRLFKYVVKVFRDSQKNPDKKVDKIVYDKQFLLIAPYLYRLGNETIKELTHEFQKIQKDDKLYAKYLEIANQMDVSNLDYVENTCEHCGSVEEAQITFPGGWKKFFVAGSSSIKKYFS